MTRSLADAALMQNITSGPHPLDHDSIRARVKLPLAPAKIKGMKIAYSVDFGYVEVDRDVRQNMLLALDVFRRLGARVEEVDLGWSASVDHDCLHWYNCMNFGRQTIWYQRDYADLMTDYALKFAEAAKRNTAMDDVHRPWQRAHLMYQTLDRCCRNTMSSSAPPTTHRPSGPITIPGMRISASTARSGSGIRMGHDPPVQHAA